jgi:6-phosphogluconolactonase
MPERLKRLICVGSYTAESGGSGPGLTVLREDGEDGEDGGALVPVAELAVPASSWVEWHPRLPVVYAANELDDGTVTAVQLGADGTPRALGDALPTGGALPCHLAVTPDGRHLLAANYGSGSVAVFALDDAGGLAARTDLVEHAGSGPVADRQEGPHAHMVTLGGDGDGDGALVTVSDLGSDTLWSYRLAPDGTLGRVAASRLPAGTGPRQLVRGAAPGVAYAVAELAAGLVRLAETSPGVFTPVGAAAPASRSGGGDDGDNLPAQFTLAAGGRLGLLSNRGPDTIAIFDLTGTGDRGPVRLAERALGAAWPRHFAVTGSRVLVAAQHSDVVVTLDLDAATGTLTERHRLPVGSPACVAVQPLAGQR